MMSNENNNSMLSNNSNCFSNNMQQTQGLSLAGTQKTIMLNEVGQPQEKKKVSFKMMKPFNKQMSNVSFESYQSNVSYQSNMSYQSKDNNTLNESYNSLNNTAGGNDDINDAELEKFMMNNLNKLNEVRDMLRGMTGQPTAPKKVIRNSGSIGTMGSIKGGPRLAPMSGISKADALSNRSQTGDKVTLNYGRPALANNTTQPELSLNAVGLQNVQLNPVKGPKTK